MASDITRTKTPEEHELETKQALLAALNAQLAQGELEFATAQRELFVFEHRYLRIVGVKFAECDELTAQIAEALRHRHPSTATRQHASEARARATESAEAAEALDSEDGVSFAPSDELKTLFRELAKRVHPDLATNDTDRVRRTRVMADVNRAYKDGDESRLRAILAEWETSPDVVTGDGVGAELVRTIRKLHQVEQRLAALTIELAALQNSDMFLLRAQVESEQILGRDLLAQMAEDLETQILALRRQLDDLNSSEVPS